MQKKKEHTTTSLLQRWLSNDGKAADERELTRQAADDAFLGEAMSGYAKHPEIDHGQALERLRGKLAQKEKRRAPMVIYLRRAAAAAAIIAATWGAWWYLYDNTPAVNDRQVAARKESTTTPEAVAPSDAPTGNPESQQPEQKAIASNSGPSSQATPTAALTQPEEKPIALLEPREEEAAKERKADAVAFMEADDAVSENTPVNVDLAKPAPAPAESRVRQAPATTAAGATAKLSGELATGTVRDANGAPLPGVVIYAPNTNKGAISDADGHFQISTEGVDKLRASYTGYLDQEFSVRNQDSFNLVMQEAANILDEVVITGYDKSAAKKKDSKMELAPFAAPVGGTNAVNRYIRKHLKYPEAAKNQGIKGSVALSFTVHADGSLSDFHTVKGLGYGCDEEAIRLLKSGPKWRINGDAKTVTATYSVPFE